MAGVHGPLPDAGGDGRRHARRRDRRLGHAGLSPPGPAAVGGGGSDRRRRLARRPGALPGVGRYTADAVAAQVDGRDVPAIETNIRRVVERRAGRGLSPAEAAAASREAGHPLTGRNRLLALMDVGAVLCRPRTPRCPVCPLEPGCDTAAVLAAGDPSTAAPAAGVGRFAPGPGGGPPPAWTALGRRRRQHRNPGPLGQLPAGAAPGRSPPVRRPRRRCPRRSGGGRSRRHRRPPRPPPLTLPEPAFHSSTPRNSGTPEW